MQSVSGRIWSVRRHGIFSSRILDFKLPKQGHLSTISGLSSSESLSFVSTRVSTTNIPGSSIDSISYLSRLLPKFASCLPLLQSTEIYRGPMAAAARSTLFSRCITTTGSSAESVSQDVSTSVPNMAPRIKFKRPDKTARHIMQILDKEAVEEVKAKREIPDIQSGYIVQLKVEAPENKRRVSTVKGIVIARRNAGLNTTFRLRRLVAGVGVECLYPLYSPNIKEIKVLDKKKVRRAKLYYLRGKMNALKKH